MLVDLIQAARQDADAIIINPAAYSFTSIAMLDAFKIFEGPIFEVHISNIHARDELHRHSKLSPAVKAVIVGRPLRLIVAMQAALQTLGSCRRVCRSRFVLGPSRRTEMQGSGYLAIWSDLAPEHETDWMHWMTREHSSERVGVEGFLACRIFRAYGLGVRRYFILYELENAAVVGGPDYLARLNAPTPWSQRIMPLLKNFARGGGTVVASAGIGQGGYIAALPFEAAELIRPRWCANSRRSIASRRFACCRPTRHKPRSRRARRACARPTARSAVWC